MKILSVFALLLMFGHFIPCHADQSPYDILNEQDLALELSQEEPYASGSGMISYDEWRCFPSKDAFVNCRDADIGFSTFHGRLKIAPRIEVTTEKEIHIFEAYNMKPRECEDTKTALSTLLRGEENFCVYAAIFIFEILEHPLYDSEATWVMHRVKTKHGIWIGPTDPSFGEERK